MLPIGRRYNKQEIARRGEAIYENDIRPNVTSADEGKFAAIDIETKHYDVDEDELEAINRLHARIPGSQVWLVRVGYPHVDRFGGHH